MELFQDIQELEDWLRPMGYVAFWDALAPYGFSMQDRDRVDGLIAGGFLAPDLALEVLKGLAVSELSHALRLKDRVPEPPNAQYLRSLH